MQKQQMLNQMLQGQQNQQQQPTNTQFGTMTNNSSQNIQGMPKMGYQTISFTSMGSGPAKQEDQKNKNDPFSNIISDDLVFGIGGKCFS